MLFRTTITFCTIIIFISCKRHDRKAVSLPYITPDSLLVKKYIDAKKIDSAFIIAEQQLDVLKKSNSFKQFIQYNQWLANKFTSIDSVWTLVKKFYQNIFSLENQFVADSSSQSAIAQAYYYWGEISIRKQNISNDSAFSCLEKAITLHHKTPALAKDDEPYAYKKLGVRYNEMGDLTKALYYYEMQLSVIGSGKPDALAAAAVNKSIVLKEVGLTDSAIGVAKKGLLLKNVEPVKMANLLTVLSEAETQKGLLPEAYKNVLAAQNILDTLITAKENIDEKRGMALKQKGILENINHQYNRAIQTQLSAIHFYRKAGDLRSRNLAKTYIELGKNYQQTGEYDSALLSYQFALYIVAPTDSADYFSLPAKAQLYAENTIMEALDAKAGALKEKFEQAKDPNYLESAVRCYDLSFEVERKLMTYLSYNESKQLMLKVSRKRSEKAIDLCFILFQITKNEQWKEQAFQFAEKSKSFILLESIKRNIAADAVLADDTVYQKVLSLQSRLSYTDNSIFEATAAKDNSRLAIFINQKSNLAKQLLLAQNELNNSNSSFKEIIGREDSISFHGVKQNILTTHTALLEFFTGDSSTYIFLITKNAPPPFIKADSSLSTSINQFLQFFTDKNKINNEPQAYQAAAYRLYQQTGLSSINKEEIKKLIIIPDGRLNFVPFDALVTAVKSTDNPQQFSYLLHQQQVSYGYSVNTLLRQTGYSSTSTGQFICFAPVFANKERGNNPLLHTIEETDAIKKENTTGKFYLKEQATINQFKNTVTAARIIHIASHASADTSGGLQPIIEFYDSSLSLNEIYTLHINPRLVVLSACETGIGIIDKSEGAMSLARGFYYAGAQNIVTSLWSVDDKSTAGIFSSFYRHTGGNDFSLALHEAKLAYLFTTSVSSASPYYWAGFIHIGHQQPPGKNNRGIWIIAVIAVALLSFFMLRKKR